VTSPDVSPPPPDLSAYIDLRIFDVTDQAMIATGLAAAKLNLPGWVPREGNTEVLIMESLALEMAEAIVAVNRLPGAVIAAFLLIAGVDRDFGAAPIATATFTLGDTVGHTIPGGTRVYLSLDDGSSVTFLVEPPGLTVAPGGSTGTVSIIGDTFTDAANGIATGVTLVMADPVPFIEHIQLATDVADGRSIETDSDWRNRGVARLSRLSDALVLPRHFEAAALERPEVARAVALDLWDGSGGAPGDDPGHITIAVLGDGGAALSAPQKAAILAALEEQAVAILVVHVIDVTVVTVPLAVTVHLRDGFDSTITSNAIKDAIADYVDPLTWQWGGVIRLNEIISLVDRVSGVDYVTAATINAVAGNYTISGAASLPKSGTVTVTVV
jgi:hypothetical protein